jgi:hypothetical protein
MTSGPERYAPPDRRSPKRLGDVDQAATNVSEGENKIRPFAPGDVAYFPRPGGEVEAANDPAAENLISALIRRVAGESMDEIDRVIRELEGVRDMLRHEGERVSRELAGYASLSHASMTAMKVIADTLEEWKGAARDKSGQRN